MLKSKWSLKKPLYLRKGSKNYDKYDNQLKKQGFSDTETWSLDCVIAEFILPRLIRFKELNNGFPGMEMNEESWNKALHEMIFAFDWVLNQETTYKDLSFDMTIEFGKRYENGMLLFAKWFGNLWW